MKNKIKNYCPLFVLFLFLFIFAFGLDPTLRYDVPIYNYIMVPHIPMNITIACFLISLFGLGILFVNKQLKFDFLSLLLLIRVILYLTTSLFLAEGEYKYGISYAMVQCFFAYIIGSNYTKEYKYVYLSLLIFSIFVSLEIFYIPLITKTNFFPVGESLSKNYMILPMGKQNYISCILIPIYLLLTNTYLKNKKIVILFTFLIGLAVLVTSSRWGFLIYLLFTFINNLNNIKTFISKKHSIFNIFLITLSIITIGLLLWFFARESIVGIVSRYSGFIFAPRLQVFKESFDIFLKHPLFGRTAYSYQVFDANSAHNFILESLIQTGIVGTIIYSLCLYLVFKQIYKINHSSIRKGYLIFIACFLVQGLAEPNLFGLRSDFLFWLIIGFGISYTKQKNNNYNSVK